MKHWKDSERKDVVNESIDMFLEEIAIVCKKHNLSIAHEDTGGAFKIEKYSNESMLWLQHAHDCT